MTAEEIVDSIIPGWSDPDNRETVCMEVQALLEEASEETVKSSMLGIVDALRAEFE